MNGHIRQRREEFIEKYGDAVSFNVYKLKGFRRSIRDHKRRGEEVGEDLPRRYRNLLDRMGLEEDQLD